MNFLIVDDERPAREELVHALGELNADIRCAQAGNGKEALSKLGESSFDVCFLDIQMPGMDGIELASKIVRESSPPLIVFATAFDQHAIQAFDLNALDYLVKPIRKERLAIVLDRIQTRLNADPEIEKQLNALREFLNGAKDGNALQRLVVEGKQGSSILLDYDQIAWMEAEGGRVFAHSVSGESFRVSDTLRDLEHRLASFGYLRVHKSYLVNLKLVVEISPMFSGSKMLTLRDSKQSKIPVSRNYAKELEQKFNR